MIAQDQQEYIVWVRVSLSNGQTEETNALGVGTRLKDYALAIKIANEIVKANDDDREVFIVRCPDGSMERDESKWELVDAH